MAAGKNALVLPLLRWLSVRRFGDVVCRCNSGAGPCFVSPSLPAIDGRSCAALDV